MWLSSVYLFYRPPLGCPVCEFLFCCAIFVTTSISDLQPRHDLWLSVEYFSAFIPRKMSSSTIQPDTELRKHFLELRSTTRSKCASSFKLLQILYALYLFYHSNTEAVLFACHLSGWATTTGKLLGLKMGKQGCRSGSWKRLNFCGSGSTLKKAAESELGSI